VATSRITAVAVIIVVITWPNAVTPAMACASAHGALRGMVSRFPTSSTTSDDV